MVPAPPPALRLCLLGGFHLEFGDAAVTLSTAAQHLLALLAITHRHRPAPRADLAERVWPDAPGCQAASNLRSVLWRLPRPRGRQLVRSEATTLRLSPDLEVDLWQGESLAELLARVDGPVEQSGAELSTLAADLLPGWDEDWLEIERESYRQKRLHALERHSARLREQGRFVDALLAGLTAVRSEPLRETAHRRVIEVHLAEGNYSEALRQYRGYERLMSDELGLLPSPAIEELVAPLTRRPSRTRR